MRFMGNALLIFFVVFPIAGVASASYSGQTSNKNYTTDKSLAEHLEEIRNPKSYKKEEKPRPKRQPDVEIQPARTLTSTAPREEAVAFPKPTPVPKTLSMDEYTFLVNIGQNISNHTISRNIYGIIEKLKTDPTMEPEEKKFLLDLSGGVNNQTVADKLRLIVERH